MCASSISILSSISTLITKEDFSNLKFRYTKLRNWINVNALLYEKTFKQSLIDRNENQKENEELNKFYKHYLDERKEIMKNIEFGVEDFFGDIISTVSFSPEQIT